MPRQRARRGSVMNRSFSQKFWEDKNGNFVVWQKPNMYLWIWFVTLFISWFAPYGWLHETIGTISLIALIIWAILEASRGVNYFRRTIGILVLVLLVLVRII